MVTRRFDPGVPAFGARWDLAQTPLCKYTSIYLYLYLYLISISLSLYLYL